MNFTVFLMIFLSIGIFRFIFVFFKSIKQKKKYYMIIPIRVPVKLIGIFVCLLFTKVVVAIYSYPQSLVFIGFSLSSVLIFFSLDIIVDKNGIHSGTRFIPWESICSLENNKWNFVAIAKKNKKEIFLKIFWNIQDSDVDKIKSYLNRYREEG